MADEEIFATPTATPTPTHAPSNHKRKLDDLNCEPLDQSTTATLSNADSESIVHGESPDTKHPEVKQPRIDESPSDSVIELEATENPQENLAEKPKEEVVERSDVERNNEQEKGQEKADEPIDDVNRESVTNETFKSAIAEQSAENPEESDEVEHQEPSEVQATQEMQPTSTGQDTSRKIEVPSNKVGVLIGKAGDMVRTLQHSSGARIQITRDADADPNSATRSVEIIGSLENINKAEKLIKDVLAEAYVGGSPSLVANGFSNFQSSTALEQIEMQVPNEKVGFIIGKGGETIKHLQSRSGSRIQVIPQHLPEGDQSKERTVRVTGDKMQIEMAREMIKEAMNQPIRSKASASGYIQQNFRPHGPQSHPTQPNGYDYTHRGQFPSQNSQHFSHGYGNYHPQQPPSRNSVGWEQRPPTNMQGPPDYYGGQAGHTHAPSGPPPMHSHGSGPGPALGPPPSQANFNYGQLQGPGYGQQPPQGYNQGPPPSAYPQGSTTHPGYMQQDQYSKPPTNNIPHQGPYVQPYGQPNQGPLSSSQSYGSYGPNAPAQQPYPYTSSGPMQQSYPQYPAAPSQGGQSGVPQHAPPANAGYGYTQSGPAASYGQYPATQPGFTEQTPTANTGYGYQGVVAGSPGTTYGPPSGGQPAAYPQSGPIQSGYDQSITQSSYHQMYVGHR